MTIRTLFRNAAVILFTLCVLGVPSALRAQENQVLGEVDFAGKTKIDRSSGVWIDGQYLGYVDELKGDKKVLLVPGQHEISVRQAGYLNFEQQLVVEPGKKVLLNVSMEKDPRAELSKVTSEIKLEVTPDRAAVIVDGAFAGTAHEFGGVGRSMLVSPGKHHVKVDLPGYRVFDTDVDLLPHQKITIKTDLVQGSITQEDPALK